MCVYLYSSPSQDINMVVNTSRHNKTEHNRAKHDVSTNLTDACMLAGSNYACSFASQGNIPFNTAQHNINAGPTDAFQTAARSAHAQPVMSQTPANPPTTKIEFLQNGTLLSMNLPIACSAREIESLQEYAMNTQCGKTNLMPGRGAYINNVGNRLRAYCTELAKSEKISGGIFDGLSKQEAEWLEEVRWREWAR